MRATSRAVASRAGLAKDEATPDIRGALERHILTAQALYPHGVLVCVFSAYVSIAFIALVQLNCAIAPRTRLSYRA